MFPLETNFEGFHDNWEWEHHYVWVGDQWLFKPERFLVGKCVWFYSHEIHSALTAEERSWLFLILETISPRTKTCTIQEIVSGFKFQANQTLTVNIYTVLVVTTGRCGELPPIQTRRNENVVHNGRIVFAGQSLPVAVSVSVKVQSKRWDRQTKSMNWLGKSAEFEDLTDVSGTRGRGFSPTYTHILTDAHKLCSCQFPFAYEHKLLQWIQ